MFIVSAYLDGRGGGRGASEDGLGCALVMEIAHVLSAVQLQTSVRMIFRNDESNAGLQGTEAY